MRVMVTGASGMLGRDLVAHLAQRHEVVEVDLDMDVTDRAAVLERVRAERPDAIIHCAAWTDVDGAEEHEEAAQAVNADGAGNVAVAAAELGVPMVYPSTDYVFPGTAGRPYGEHDPVAPLSAYGRTKLAGEREAARQHPEGLRVARTAWLYGAAGRNFVDTMRRLGAARDELTVVHDQEGCPTWTRELAPALEALIDLPPGVYHTAGGGSVTWADFARAIFEETGTDCAVVSITTEQLGRPAPRPACSALVSHREDAPRLRHWREALRDYLRETG